MAQTDKPSLYQGSLAATRVYTGADTPDTTGDTASPPLGSLYVQRDPTGAGPQGEVGIYEYAPSYTPAAGMGAVPEGWRPLVGGEVINVKRFGATGDGTTDDFPAISAALAAATKPVGAFGAGAQGAIVFFPPGVYLVSQPLDCTQGQFNLVGSGVYQTVLLGATGSGNCVIDFTGGGYSTVRDIFIYIPFTTVNGQKVPAPDASTVGILIARDTSLGSVSQINLQNMMVQLASEAGANNGNGTVAVYNFGGEQANYHNVYLQGDCGLMITAANSYGLASDYNTISTQNASTTALSVTGLSTLIGIAGPALRLNGGAALQVDAFLSTAAGMPGIYSSMTPYPFAIHSQAIWVDFRHTGSMEGFDGLLHVDGVTMFRPRLYSYMGRSTAQPAILLSGGGSLLDAEVDIVPTNANAGTVNCLIADDKVEPAKIVQGCRVKLRNQTIQLQSPGSQILSNVIQSEVPLATTLTNISAADTIAGNVITATDAVQANGVTLSTATGWSAPTGTASRSTFDTATATTQDLAETLMALIDDLTAGGYLGA